jgi:hypothetical protein
MADKNLLLVEGKDDQHVLLNLTAYHKLPELFRIKDKGGVNNLLTTLDVEIEASGLERLGIVIDADVDLSIRWQSVRDVLTRAGYTDVPLVPERLGTIIKQADHPVIGIWIMPDNVLASGMLEHFIGFLVPAADTLWDYARDCVDQIPKTDRRFPPQHQIKAHVHTWLAWQEEPGSPLGQAITKRYLDADATHAKQLIAWLQRLFAI